MLTNVVMPSLGLTMAEGRIIEWLKSEGDQVEEGKPLFVIESEKATVEIDAPAGGFLRKILVEQDVTVPVGEPVGVIGDDLNEKIEVPSESKREKEADDEVKTEKPGPSAESGKESGNIVASPIAKKLAKENGIDLTVVTGTGPGGRITKDDVREVMKSGTSAKVTQEEIPLQGIRKVMASRMSESAHTAAAVTLMCRSDAGALVQSRASIQGASYNDLLCVIVRKALQKFPELNSRLDGANIVRPESINIGIAVETESGLLVPIIKNTENLSLSEISEQSKELIKKAKSGNLLPEEMADGTFTITNLGMYGIETFTPIINLPECAILGVGTIRETVFVCEGKLSIGKEMKLSLSFDHRIVDGAAAAKFLQAIVEAVENPEPDFWI
jgi:pyruvate dehydrogenase E2 component (dihydrolipoamide acetyltransferase)